MQYKTRIEGIDVAKVPFAGELLIAFDERGYEVIETFVGSVDLSRVRGCYHPNYSGKSWGELKPVASSMDENKNEQRIAYQSLKRASINVNHLHQNPSYYLGKDEKRHWSFYELSGVYFISSGVHRTVIGRFFFWLNNLDPLVYGVSITRLKTVTPEVNVEKDCKLSAVKWFKHVLFREKYNGNQG